MTEELTRRALALLDQLDHQGVLIVRDPERRARALDAITAHLTSFGREVAQAARMGAADGVVAVLGPASVSLRPGAVREYP